jgi:hypothetical protein
MPPGAGGLGKNSTPLTALIRPPATFSHPMGEGIYFVGREPRAAPASAGLPWGKIFRPVRLHPITARQVGALIRVNSPAATGASTAGEIRVKKSAFIRVHLRFELALRLRIFRLQFISGATGCIEKFVSLRVPSWLKSAK